MAKTKEENFFKGNWMTKKRAMGIWDLSYKIEEVRADIKSWNIHLKFKRDQEAIKIAANHLQEAKKKIDLIGHRINNLEEN